LAHQERPQHTISRRICLFSPVPDVPKPAPILSFYPQASLSLWHIRNKLLAHQERPFGTSGTNYWHIRNGPLSERIEFACAFDRRKAGNSLTHKDLTSLTLATACV
jgi:hypothetical protein